MAVINWIKPILIWVHGVGSWSSPLRPWTMWWSY